MTSKQRNNSILFLLLIICLIQGCKGPGWESVNIQIPSTFAEDWGIRDFSFVDDFTGYANLSVQATNACGPSTASPILQINLRPFPAVPDTPTGPTSMCQSSPPSVYTTNPAANADSYVWRLEPASAGTIVGTGTTGEVNWDPDFSGMAR